MSELKPKDYDALYWLQHEFGGSVLISRLSDKDAVDHMGSGSYGLNRFKRLDKSGHVIITVEDPIEMEDGVFFEFTPSVEITELGLQAIANYH